MTSSIAFVFPGQGSQRVGMLGQLAKQYPVIEETFAESSTILGYDLWTLSQTGSADHLNQTIVTQPALLTAGVALWRVVIDQLSEKPALLAGHSLGEYTALVASKAITFSDAVSLVLERARLMQEAVPVGEGAMAAIIGLSDDAVDALCQEHSTDSDHRVSCANYNAIGQVVVAGHTAAVDAVIAAAKPAGARLAKKLPMSVPSHCVLMQSAADGLQTYLQSVEMKIPQIPVINNVDVLMPSEPEHIKEALVRQLTHGVQWVKTVHTMQENGINTLVECGPGNVLSGLLKRINKEMKSIVLDKDTLNIEEIVS